MSTQINSTPDSAEGKPTCRGAQAARRMARSFLERAQRIERGELPSEHYDAWHVRQGALRWYENARDAEGLTPPNRKLLAAIQAALREAEEL